MHLGSQAQPALSHGSHCPPGTGEPRCPGALWYLQELGVLLAKLLEEGGQQGRVLLNHLPHVLELGLLPQELQGVLTWGVGVVKLSYTPKGAGSQSPSPPCRAHPPSDVGGSGAWLSWMGARSRSGLPGMPCGAQWQRLEPRHPGCQLYPLPNPLEKTQEFWSFSTQGYSQTPGVPHTQHFPAFAHRREPSCPGSQVPLPIPGHPSAPLPKTRDKRTQVSLLPAPYSQHYPLLPKARDRTHASWLLGPHPQLLPTPPSPELGISHSSHGDFHVPLCSDPSSLLPSIELKQNPAVLAPRGGAHHEQVLYSTVRIVVAGSECSHHLLSLVAH